MDDFNVNWTKAQKELGNYFKKLEGIDNYFKNQFNTDFKNLSDVAEFDFKYRIAAEKTSPAGFDWKPLSEFYKAWKIKVYGTGEIGIRTGDMLRRTKTSLDLKQYDKSFMVGSDVSYAEEFHNVRPVWGFSKEQQQRYVSYLEDKLIKILE